ncbi:MULTISPECIES: protein translocase subunit SecF [Luteimonas]|uniref:protein translocase subunit SecF n=1 Tax=Luteimonas TaxID=83614 RepID=UPI000C7BEE84|nr:MULTISPECIES: protein translocase subunit SecF [Luteimonas]
MTLFPLSLIPNDTRIDFMRFRHIWLLIAATLIVGALAVIGIKGFNFALDFTGGTAVNVRFENPVSVDDVRERLDVAGVENAQVQTFGSGNDLLIRVRAAEDVTNVDGKTTDENPGRILGIESIGSQVSGDLRQNAIYAAIFVLVGFLLYIGFRFELKFAIVASITTLFDVLVVAGLFALTGREFDLTVLAGLLAVMGFSINDTIVVFDRVRENFRGLRAEPLEVFNRSINQTLSRTIITSLVFFLSVLALFLYGGGSLEGLALTQMIGAVVATLSSILIACPLLTVGPLRVTKQDLLPKARDEAALARRP